MLGLENGKTILDPFCGTGTFLIEAIIQGYKVAGVDNRKECVFGTKKNLLWIMKEYNLKNRIRYVKQDNAEKLSCVETSTIDGIVTEPILLPNFKNIPNYELAEDVLKQLGLKTFRVRHHKDIARIEIHPEDMYLIFEDNNRTKMVNGIKDAGYAHVTLDLSGFKSGSLNDYIETNKLTL